MHSSGYTDLALVYSQRDPILAKPSVVGSWLDSRTKGPDHLPMRPYPKIAMLNRVVDNTVVAVPIQQRLIHLLAVVSVVALCSA